MTSDVLKDVLKRLETNDPAAIEQCLNEVEAYCLQLSDQELADSGSRQCGFLFDTYEYPHLQPVVRPRGEDTRPRPVSG